jgi:myo-inositol-hexaphosphate 3-phosphohydrolase
VTGKVYAIVTTDDGDLEQLELNARGGAVEGRSIRRVPLGRGAGACAADDASQTVIVAVETSGLWRLAAEPESDATPVQLDALAPFGALSKEVKGVALSRRRTPST